LNQKCTDGVQLHLNTVLTFGPPELVTNLCSNNGTEQFDTGLGATMGLPVDRPLDGKREFKCLEDTYGFMEWQPTTTAWFQELWKADGNIDLPGNQQEIQFSPYYGVLDQQRYVDHEWVSRQRPNAYFSTLDLCYQDNPSYRQDRAAPSFCQFAPSSLDGLSSEDRLRHPDNPMKGAIRAIHPKELAIRSENVPGGEADFVRFCTNARGQNADVLEAGESCPAGELEQFVSRKDRWYRGWAGSDINAQVVNGQLIGSGMFKEWTRDYRHPTIRYPN